MPVGCRWVALLAFAGCGHVIPFVGTIRGEGNANITADANVRGGLEIKMPSAVDPGNMTATVVRAGQSASGCCANRLG